MEVITDKMLERMETELKQVLPPEFRNFVYEVESNTSLLINFMIDFLPSRTQLEQFIEIASTCIDAIIPAGEKVSNWLAVVRVGAKRMNRLAVGGVRVIGFEGRTIKYGVGSSY